MTALLEVENVTAGYVEDINILQNVSMRIEEGAIVGMIGLNGAGKSTIMKTVLGFLAPREGRIRLAGEDITGSQPHTLIDRGVTYIPQESSLFPYMPVEDNLTLPLRHLQRATGSPSREEARERLAETLERFPVLAERRSAPAGNLSGGQQKMLEFAKAYLQRPRLCLIDEPSIGLSPKVAGEVYQWIGLFAEQRMSILLVDHNVRKVIAMAGYVYVLSLGQVTAEGRREDFEGDLHAQVREWLGITF
jgi:branched-chain amino acid transport system ATP-binding protein